MDRKRQCDNCKWGNCIYFKPRDYFCGKYKMKPNGVYYLGEPCEKFEQKVEKDDGNINK